MHEYQFIINGNPYNTKIIEITEEQAVIEVNGTRFQVNIEEIFKQKTPRLVRPHVIESSITRTPLTEKPGKDLSPRNVKAPLPGVIIEIMVKVGDNVKAAQPLLKMEAMKMENEIQSPISGTVKEIFVEKGASVLEGAPLIRIE